MATADDHDQVIAAQQDASFWAHENCVYVYDVQAGWVAAGGVQVGYFEALRSLTERAADIHNIICSETTLLASRLARADDPDTIQLVSKLPAYFTSTVLADTIELIGSRVGHWLCLVYTPKGGARVCRPAYKPSFKNHTDCDGLLSLQDLESWIVETVRMDSNPASKLATAHQSKNMLLNNGIEKALGDDLAPSSYSRN